MDQYLVNFDLIKESENTDLLDYVDSLQKIDDDETPKFFHCFDYDPRWAILPNVKYMVWR